MFRSMELNCISHYTDVVVNDVCNINVMKIFPKMSQIYIDQCYKLRIHSVEINNPYKLLL